MIEQSPVQLASTADKRGGYPRTSSAVQVSAVITTRNRADLLWESLRSFAAQKVDDPALVEIVVIDNASTDNTKQVVEEIAAHSPITVRYIYEGTPSYPLALNRGVTESSGEWIAFCDDDQLPHPDLLARLTAVAVNKGAGCVGGTTRLRLQGQQPRWLGPVGRSLLGEHVFEGAPTRCNGRILPAGGNMMVSRKVFDATGLFDKSMSAGNDMEILRRARAAGFSIWAVPSAETYHLVPEYRLRREYLRWVSLRWGSHFAEVDWKLLGGFRTSTLCVARVGHALLVRIPLLAIAYFAKREATFTDYQFLLWRAWGYARRCLYLTNPTIFAQPGFLKFLHFGVQEKFQNQPRRVLP